MTPVDQLIVAPTKEAVEAAIYDVLISLQLPTTAWQPGRVVRMIITSVAWVIAAFLVLIAKANQSNFLDLATGDWLTWRAQQNYGVDRLPASYATTTLTLTNAGGGLYSCDPGELVVKNSSTGELFTNDAAFTLNPLSTLDVAISARVAGTAGNSAATAIDTMVTVYAGVTCSNSVACFGVNEETDAELRERCHDSLGRLSPFGPSAAYVYYAKSALALDGSPIGVKRVWVSPSGVPVQVYVATASGALSGTVGDTSTPLGKVDDDIQRNAVPNPVTCTVDSATNVTVAIVGTVYVNAAANLTTTEVENLADLGVDTLFQTVPIGGVVISPATGKLYVKQIEAAVERTSPYIIKCNVATPASDVALAEGEVPALSTKTWTVVQVQVQ